MKSSQQSQPALGAAPSALKRDNKVGKKGGSVKISEEPSVSAPMGPIGLIKSTAGHTHGGAVVDKPGTRKHVLLEDVAGSPQHHQRQRLTSQLRLRWHDGMLPEDQKEDGPIPPSQLLPHNTTEATEKILAQLKKAAAKAHTQVVGRVEPATLPSALDDDDDDDDDGGRAAKQEAAAKDDAEAERRFSISMFTPIETSASATPVTAGWNRLARRRASSIVPLSGCGVASSSPYILHCYDDEDVDCIGDYDPDLHVPRKSVGLSKSMIGDQAPEDSGGVPAAPSQPHRRSGSLSAVVMAAKDVERERVRNDFLTVWAKPAGSNVTGTAIVLKRFTEEQLARLKSNWTALTNRVKLRTKTAILERIARREQERNAARVNRTKGATLLGGRQRSVTIAGASEGNADDDDDSAISSDDGGDAIRLAACDIVRPGSVNMDEFTYLLRPFLIELGEFTPWGDSVALKGRRRSSVVVSSSNGTGALSAAMLNAQQSEDWVVPELKEPHVFGEFVGDHRSEEEGDHTSLRGGETTPALLAPPSSNGNKTWSFRYTMKEGASVAGPGDTAGSTPIFPKSPSAMESRVERTAGASTLIASSVTGTDDDTDVVKFIRDLYLSIDLDRTGAVSWEVFITFVIERTYGHALETQEETARRVAEEKRTAEVIQQLTQGNMGGGTKRHATQAYKAAVPLTSGSSTTGEGTIGSDMGGNYKVNPITGTKTTLQYRSSFALTEPATGVPHWVTRMRYFPGWNAVGFLNQNVAGVMLLEDVDRVLNSTSTAGKEEGMKLDEEDAAEEKKESGFEKWKRQRNEAKIRTEQWTARQNDGASPRNSSAAGVGGGGGAGAGAAGVGGPGHAKGSAGSVGPRVMYAHAPGLGSSMEYLPTVSVLATVCNAAERQISLHSVHGRSELGGGKSLKVPLPGFEDNIACLRSYHRAHDVVDPDERLSRVTDQDEKALLLAGTRSGHMLACAVSTTMMRKGSHLSTMPVVEQYAMHSSDLTDILVLPRTGKVITCGLDGRVLLHDPNAGIPHSGAFTGHEKGVYLLEYCSSFEVFVSAGFEFRALCWAENLPNCPAFELVDHTSPHAHPLSAVVAVDGTPQVYTVDYSGVVKLFDVRSLKVLDSWRAFDTSRVPVDIVNEVRSGAIRGSVHLGDVGSVCYTGSTHRTLLFGSRRVHAFHTEVHNADAERAHDLSDPMTAMDVGRRFFATAAGQTVKTWSVNEGVEIGTHQTARFCHSPVTVLKIDSSSGKIYTGHVDGTIIAFDADTSVLCRRFLKHDAPIKALEYDSLNGLLITTSLRGDFFVWNDPDRETSPFSSTAHLKCLYGHLTRIPRSYVRHSPVQFPPHAVSQLIRSIPLAVRRQRLATWVARRWRQFAKKRTETRIKREHNSLQLEIGQAKQQHGNARENALDIALESGAKDSEAKTDVRYVTTTSLLGQLFVRHCITAVVNSPRFMMCAALSSKSNCRIIDYSNPRKPKVACRLFHGEERELVAVAFLAERGLVAVSDSMGGMYVWLLPPYDDVRHAGHGHDATDGAVASGFYYHHPFAAHNFDRALVQPMRPTGGASATDNSSAGKKSTDNSSAGFAVPEFPEGAVVPPPMRPAALLCKFMNRCQVVTYSHPLKEMGVDSNTGADQESYQALIDAVLEPEMDETDRQAVEEMKLIMQRGAGGGGGAHGDGSSKGQRGSLSDSRHAPGSSMMGASTTTTPTPTGDPNRSVLHNKQRKYSTQSAEAINSARSQGSLNSMQTLNTDVTSRRTSLSSVVPVSSGATAQDSLAALPAVTAMYLDRIRMSLITGDDVGLISIYDIDPVYESIGETSVALLPKVPTGKPPRFVHSWRGHEYPVAKIQLMPHSMYTIVTVAIDNIVALWACDGTWVAGLRQGPIVHRVWKFPNKTVGDHALIRQRWGRIRDAVRHGDLKDYVSTRLIQTKHQQQQQQRSNSSTAVGSVLVPMLEMPTSGVHSGPSTRRSQRAPSVSSKSDSTTPHQLMMTTGHSPASVDVIDPIAVALELSTFTPPPFSKAILDFLHPRRPTGHETASLVSSSFIRATTNNGNTTNNINEIGMNSAAGQPAERGRRKSSKPTMKTGRGEDALRRRSSSVTSVGSVGSSNGSSAGERHRGSYRQQQKRMGESTMSSSGANDGTLIGAAKKGKHLTKISYGGGRPEPDADSPSPRDRSSPRSNMGGDGLRQKGQYVDEDGTLLVQFPGAPPLPEAPTVEFNHLYVSKLTFEANNRALQSTSSVAGAIQRAFQVTGTPDPDLPPAMQGTVIGDDPLKAAQRNLDRYRKKGFDIKPDSRALAEAKIKKYAALQQAQAKKHLATMKAVHAVGGESESEPSLTPSNPTEEGGGVKLPGILYANDEDDHWKVQPVPQSAPDTSAMRFIAGSVSLGRSVVDVRFPVSSLGRSPPPMLKSMLGSKPSTPSVTKTRTTVPDALPPHALTPPPGEPSFIVGLSRSSTPSVGLRPKDLPSTPQSKTQLLSRAIFKTELPPRASTPAVTPPKSDPAPSTPDLKPLTLPIASFRAPNVAFRGLGIKSP